MPSRQKERKAPRLVAPAEQIGDDASGDDGSYQNHEAHEREASFSLRPKALGDFIGQSAICENLQVFVQAAKMRGEPLDHILFAGPPGLGKTTLAHIAAAARDVQLRATSGPILQRPGDLAAILTNLQPNDILFIDEIHRLAPPVEEILYPALEDFVLDLVVGSGPGARSLRVGLNPFTLAGATTRTGLITTPLHDRFGIVMRLDYYGAEDLEKIVLRASDLLGMALHRDAAREIARRSRGTPRVAQRLLRRIRDFAVHSGEAEISLSRARDALARLRVDGEGLDALDHRYLMCLARDFGGRPTGIETLAAALGETRDTLEDALEPYLIRRGFVFRTPRGRVASARAFGHLGLAVPSGGQASLFVEKGRAD